MIERRINLAAFVATLELYKTSPWFGSWLLRHLHLPKPMMGFNIEKVIFKLNRELDITVILVEQTVRFVREVFLRFAMMEMGRIVAEGKTSKLTDDLVRKHMTV